MKPPNITSPKSVVITVLSVVLVVSAAVAHAAAQNKPQYTLAEYNAFQALNMEKNAAVKIKLWMILPQIWEFLLDARNLCGLLSDVFQLKRLSPHCRSTWTNFWRSPTKLVLIIHACLPSWPVQRHTLRIATIVCSKRQASAKAEDAAAEGLQVLRQLPTPPGA